MPRPTSLMVSMAHRSASKESVKGYFAVAPVALALVTSIFILLYVSSTSKLVINHTHLPHTPIKPAVDDDHESSRLTILPIPTNPVFHRVSLQQKHPQPPSELNELAQPLMKMNFSGQEFDGQRSTRTVVGSLGPTEKVNIAPPHGRNSPVLENQERSEGNRVKNTDVFHDRDIFMGNYREMNSSFKIFIYPHKRNDPFANVLLPVKNELGGNYASESHFKKALAKSHFITKDPSQADLFYLPFSIASLRHDKRVGVGGIQDFIKDYVFNISRKYPYWNRTGGADHFYVACHSIGRTAMEKAMQVRINAIQVVCSSTYFVPGYIAHKDASIPQIWPRQGVAPNRSPSKRKNLAFYAGALNSRVRESLVRVWRNDSEISVHKNRLKTPYSESLLNSKFCIHAKGYEVNTARIGDALYYGCVPVILADYYDLPFADILNWKSFSVVVLTSDIPLLKEILKNLDFDEYLRLQGNVLRVRKHFQWHDSAIDYDAFYMVMYELWIRRSSLRIFNPLFDQR